MTDAAIGHGGAFHRSSDGTSGGTFTAVAELTSLSVDGISREVVDATHMGSTDRFREYIGGVKDGGQVSIECNFDPDDTDVTNWLADINANTSGYYKVIWPDATEWGFPGFATEMSVSGPLDDKMVISITYQVTGKPAFFA